MHSKLNSTIHFLKQPQVDPGTGDIVNAQTGDFGLYIALIIIGLLFLCITYFVAKKGFFSSNNNSIALNSIIVKTASIGLLILSVCCLFFGITKVAFAAESNDPVAPEIVYGYVDENGAVSIDSYDVDAVGGACKFNNLGLSQICEGDLGIWTIKLDDNQVFTGALVEASSISLDNILLNPNDKLKVSITCQMDPDLALSLIDKDVITDTFTYENVVIHKATVDFGEGSVQGHPQNWTEVIAGKNYTKYFEQGYAVEEILKDWENFEVSAPAGRPYTGLSPYEGTLDEDTQFNAMYAAELWTGKGYIGWDSEGQIYLLSDGGVELQEHNAKAGDIVCFHFDLSDPVFTQGWKFQIFEGHWGSGCLGDFKSDNWDIFAHDGNIYFELTASFLAQAYEPQWWGGTFVVQGQDLVVTSVSLVQK